MALRPLRPQFAQLFWRFRNALAAALWVIAAVGTANCSAEAAEGLNLSDSPSPAWYFPYPAWKGARGPANAQGRVEALCCVGDVVYVGGDLMMGADGKGRTAARTGLAGIDLKSGELTEFGPKMDGRVYALAASADGKVLFAGGQFANVNGVARRGVLVFEVAGVGGVVV